MNNDRKDKTADLLLNSPLRDSELELSRSKETSGRETLQFTPKRDEIRELKLAALRKEIQKGIESGEQGRSIDGRKAMAEKRKRLLKMIGQNG